MKALKDLKDQAAEAAEGVSSEQKEASQYARSLIEASRPAWPTLGGRC